MKKLILCLILAFWVVQQPVKTSAESITRNFEYIDTEKDILIHVIWEKEQPDLLFIAPDGTQYNPELEQEGAMTVIGADEMFYLIYKAPKGQWKITYDKKSNETIQIGVEDYNTNFFISSFTIGQMDGSMLPVVFQAEHSTYDVQYQYVISAVIEKLGEEKELARGRAYANQESSIMLNLEKLASYSDYMLQLYVVYNDNGTDIFDMIYSEPFSYTNPATPQAVTDYTVLMKPDEYLVDIRWDNYPRNAQSVMIALFQNNETEPVFYDEYHPDDKSVSLSYYPGVETLKIDFSVKTNDLYSEPLVKTIELTASASIEFEDILAMNKNMLEMRYHHFSKQKAILTVNENQTELYLDGSGGMGIGLQDDWNHVNVTYTDSNNISWIVSKEIFVDRIPPVLSLFEDYNGILTKDSEFMIVGSVGDCSSLVINGQEVQFDVDGSFSHTVALHDGENRFDCVASDAVGNETLYTAVITKVSGSDKAASDKQNTVKGIRGYLPLIIGSALGFLALLYALIFWRKRKPN